MILRSSAQQYVGWGWGKWEKTMSSVMTMPTGGKEQGALKSWCLSSVRAGKLLFTLLVPRTLYDM